MAEKRFTCKIDEIFDEGNHFAYALSKENAEDIVELLNELHEENQELKRLVKVTVEDYTDLKQSFDLIDKENEQLKKELNAFKPIVFEDVNGGGSILYEKVEK